MLAFIAGERKILILLNYFNITALNLLNSESGTESMSSVLSNLMSKSSE